MFKLFKKNNATVPVVKEVPAAAGTFSVGDALIISAGNVTKATGINKPEFVSAGKGTLASGDTLAVNPIYEDMEFVTTFATTASSVKVGEKVTIHTDAAQVTATTTSGVAEIVEIVDSAAGGEVVVKF